MDKGLSPSGRVGSAPCEARGAARGEGWAGRGAGPEVPAASERERGGLRCAPLLPVRHDDRPLSRRFQSLVMPFIFLAVFDSFDFMAGGVLSHAPGCTRPPSSLTIRRSPRSPPFDMGSRS